ncbi:uncharacterized protein LOC112557673 [Pomacea canaliculata]|uniref:uncharacterized protein LOC112557673 n=1 Tax=Pomacea canaliculata TaxID=400727 RepID=UPI000D72E0ED|nr:uncharacterized protein LOC112557673 [Pomacea canaliculata]
MNMSVFLLILLVLHVSASGAVRLDSYNVDPKSLSVSGISSGAAMATQFHVAHSSVVMGVGLVAGVPFMCSGGNLVTATGVCMELPSTILVSALEAVTASGALVGNIDSTSNMRNDRVWIYAGTHDSVVKPAAGEKIRDYYAHYVNQNNIKTVFNIASEHCMPTANYGGRCDALNSDNYLNNCNYDAAFELLNHIYGGNLKHGTAAHGSLIKFDQSDFFYFSSPSVYSMDDVGYVYIPSGCASKHSACKLHVAFHGCKMGQTRIGDAYVRHAGYNEVGEANNIIILYPQVTASLTNPNGCWDWWGYTGLLFATHSGFQMTAVYRMVEKVMDL